MYVKALTAAATAGGTSAPTLATDGRALRKGCAQLEPTEGFDDQVDECEILVYGTRSGGSAVSVAFVRVWGYEAKSAMWYPLGEGVTDNKGKLNPDATVAFVIDETSSGNLRHAERLAGIREFTRVYIQYGAITNTFNASGLNVLLVNRG